MLTSSNIRSMLLGALVADAAALGVHWIYDVKRLSDVAKARGATAFTPVDPTNYNGVPAYFAHGARLSGDLTQYGEVLRLMIKHLADGTLDVAAYQQEYAAYFGAGGAYSGYIDRPTRGALANIDAEREISGIDDDQLPATATLPAVFAAFHGADTLGARLSAAMEVTNVNAIAQDYCTVFADVLKRLTAGESLNQALRAAANVARDAAVKSALNAALDEASSDSIAYGEQTGRACHLPMAGPLVFHILTHANSFADAVERNNRAGGDSAGRAILIGAVMGLIHGLDDAHGIPLSWVLNLRNGQQIWEECQTLVSA